MQNYLKYIFINFNYFFYHFLKNLHNHSLPLFKVKAIIVDYVTTLLKPLF